MKNIKPKKQMSRLEKLPVELLEMIYLFTMDISLPRSSPVIAGKLSWEGIYVQTIIGAFGPTWALFDGHTGAADNYAGDFPASFQVSYTDHLKENNN
jgi:hypothetical protein